MNFNYLIYLSAISLTFFSCQGESEIWPELEETYVLTKQSFNNQNASNREFYNFNYNQEGLIEEIQRVQSGIYIVNDNEEVNWQDTSFLYFEYENKLLIKTIIKEGNNLWFDRYEYNDDFLIKKTTYYADNSIQDYSLYTYNDDGKLMEISRWTDKEDYRFIFEYHGENLASVTINNLRDNPKRKEKIEYSGFDNKTNYSTKINGLPFSFIRESSVHTYSSVSPNNIQFEKHYWSVDISAEFEDPTITEYRYEYNEIGLPSVMYYSGWEVTFEYEVIKASK